MVGKWKHTQIYHANIHMWQSATAMYCAVWGAPSQSVIVEEFFYILQQLTDEDHDGCIVLGYELMLEAEHRFRIKWSGCARCHWSPSNSTSNAPPCSPETLDLMTWSNPDSRMLECFQWSVYDGILTLGPTPKLMGPKSYNQVIRDLTAKAFRGLQVHCSARTSAQFNELSHSRVWSVVLVPPQCEGTKKAEAMDTASLKDEDTEEGAMGVKQTLTQICTCLDVWPPVWVHWWTDRVFALAQSIDGWKWAHDSATGMLALVDVALVFCHPSNVMPACPNQHVNQTVGTGEPGGGGETGFVDRSICVLPAAHSRGHYRMIMDVSGRGDGPANQPPCSGISGGHWKAHEPSCNMQVLAART